jgi:hypothetical protein
VLRRLFGLVGLIITLISGYLMGTIIGLVFIIPFILIRHTNETEQNWLLLAAGSAGALIAWLKRRAPGAGLEDTWRRAWLGPMGERAGGPGVAGRGGRG